MQISIYFFKFDNIPVLYAPARREVHAGQRISMLRRQWFLYECLPIVKLPQPGPYAGPYCTKAHNQCEPSHQGGPRIRSNPLPGHPPGRISPRRTGYLNQCPLERSLVSCLADSCKHHQFSPSANQYHRPRPRHSGGRRERQKKLKSHTTNRKSNRVTQSAHQPIQ